MDLAEVSKLTEEQAMAHFEAMRWPGGPICIKCGDPSNVVRIAGKYAHRGLLRCKSCRKQFTVRVGTIFEDSHIPFKTWLIAIHILCASKKGMSAHQLHRMMGITYKSAWFMAHRIRLSMTKNQLAGRLKGTVEADETYIGGKETGRRGRGGNKTPVFSLVERGGDVRSFQMERVTKKNLREVLLSNVVPSSKLMTDSFPGYKGMKSLFRHQSVNHKRKEYVRGEVYTNTIEGFFSILKRGLDGVYQHVSKKHLKRYLNEFDFRYNTREFSDGERADLAIKRAENQRLSYYRPAGASTT